MKARDIVDKFDEAEKEARKMALSTKGIKKAMTGKQSFIYVPKDRKFYLQVLNDDDMETQVAFNISMVLKDE